MFNISIQCCPSCCPTCLPDAVHPAPTPTSAPVPISASVPFPVQYLSQSTVLRSVPISVTIFIPISEPITVPKNSLLLPAAIILDYILYSKPTCGDFGTHGQGCFGSPSRTTVRPATDPGCGNGYRVGQLQGYTNGVPRHSDF